MCDTETSEYSELKERYTLVFERIGKIPKEDTVAEPFQDYFIKTSTFLFSIYAFMETREEQEDHPAFWRVWHDGFYGDIAGDAYEHSYANPAYARTAFGEEHSAHAQILSFLTWELRSIIPYAYEGKLEEITILAELFVEIYGLYEEEIPEINHLRNHIYWYAFDYLPVFLDRRVEEQIDPSHDFAVQLILSTAKRIESGHPDETDLYRFGEYVTEDDLTFFRFINSLPDEDVDALAKTFTEGYRIGFVKAGKDLSGKQTVNIRYQLGFERVIARAIRNFEEMGLKPVIYRAARGIHAGGGNYVGYFGGIPNRQYDFDHRMDAAIFLDKRYVSRRLEVLKNAYESRKELARGMAGPAVVELFGELPFSPEVKDEATKYSEKQQKLRVEMMAGASEIVNTYIPGEERSFTIISFPTPQIGPDFPEIFRDVVRINTLDANLYEEIQQKLINALDQGVKVQIKGQNGNKTDLTVALTSLSDPTKETIFENCVADVNIPVGEVFTTPKLDGTNGTLHVKGTYLNSLFYQDLELSFSDGVITDYSCGNYEEKEKGRSFIQNNLLHDHETLPLGEFAIGTNTLAAVMTKKYQIEDRMTILIAEKTGPHFAVGDSCYSHEEDNPVYNPDGKEVIARENHFSLLRKTEDANKAYFQCHTDITIPYEELGSITVICEDGREIVLLKNGRFVLPGTEILNTPFEE